MSVRGACLTALALLGAIATCNGLVVPLSPSNPATSLSGITLPRADGVGEASTVDLGQAVASTSGKTLVVLGTHAADFNSVEYIQRVKAYWPRLEAKGVNRCLVVINGESDQCEKLAELLDVPKSIEILADPTGEAGRRFGVSRGFRPDDAGLSPFLKLFVMGIVGGPGAWYTLPAVLIGYFGNPNGKRAWIENALIQGQQAGRWPTVLDVASDGKVVGNKFDDAPVVSSWGVRPFELATLRLQNLIGVQGQNWDALKPTDDRCLTQLGGCTVVEKGEALYSWVDRGLCDVPDFDELVEAI
eukprot:CAMPEP_0119477300 /NCGR_PEP_ID=MMETSP1344-20130328/7495_1 /TAXON_ID=236787 /ORGANISM="Florenciella parvula, Strain CCMP2471" /LENGTH=300 /DNA_ID=CAMNT_0007511263 /DNA_START=839 /DNA_END=1741 /DNA_ORIENTATION=+